MTAGARWPTVDASVAATIAHGRERERERERKEREKREEEERLVSINAVH
jgi:hypothetical protein